MKKTSPRRADRSPERCRAGGGLLGGKDPAGRFPLNVVSSVINGYARIPNQRANGECATIVCGYSFSAVRAAWPAQNIMRETGAEPAEFPRLSDFSSTEAKNAVDRRSGLISGRKLMI